MRKMRKPSDLTEDELQSIAGHVQDWLYYDTSLPVDSPCRYRRHDVDGAAMVVALGELLGELDMDPLTDEELEGKRKHEEFAQFVGDLMKDPPATPAEDDALLGSMADAAAADDPNRTRPLTEPIALATEDDPASLRREGWTVEICRWRVKETRGAAK